jgi:aldose 1-epimerase
MLAASLRHKGVQMLRRVGDLQTAAAKGSTAGIALLHPWANRLDGIRYRAAGREVQLDTSSPLLHLDAHGLPMHGVPWSRLAWEPLKSQRDRLSARLEWSGKDLLDIFPFPHRLELTARLCPEALTFETTLIAGADAAVPVSFGFHPYFGVPDLPRAKWQLELPAMRRLLLDERGIPSGAQEPWSRFDAEIGMRSFDDGFALLSESVLLAHRRASSYYGGISCGLSLCPDLCPSRAGVRGDRADDRAHQCPHERARTHRGSSARTL